MSLNEIDENTVNKTILEYEYIIRIIITKYKISPRDQDDAMQEGRLGLLKAITAYKNDGGASFVTFASLCVERQILSFLRMQKRKKNQMITYSYSIDAWCKDLEEQLIHEKLDNYIISKVYYIDVLKRTIIKMNTLERTIFYKFLNGYTINELSDSYKIPKKQVYVIIAKVKKKIQEKLNDF